MPAPRAFAIWGKEGKTIEAYGEYGHLVILSQMSLASFPPLPSVSFPFVSTVTNVNIMERSQRGLQAFGHEETSKHRQNKQHLFK